MENNKKPVEKKRKKKGRPSLLDLQKRRLQEQQQQEKQNPNPSPNPYLRFPNTDSGRRISRRNRNPDDPPLPGDDDDDEDDDSSGHRREKKLKLVVNLPTLSANSSARPSDSAATGSDGEGIGGRLLGDGDQDKAERSNSSKATDPLQEGGSDSGPTTPLPDKKLLVFILDRLQKKDTYGVFSEPVDPEELPDYHEKIENPMDFGTVRKKLSDGAYANLEQFEKDVFLISSNAMLFNPPSSIYYRQARSIHELAKKNFENLRQESDDNKLEPKPEPKPVARRGRPPGKSTIRRTVACPAERTASDFSSDATLANAGDNTHWSNSTHGLPRKGSASDKPGTAGVSTRASLGLRNSGTFGWMGEHKAEKHEQYSGSALNRVPVKCGRKPTVIDDSRRNTYIQPQPSTCARQPPLFSTFEGGQRQLAPVGLHMEHAYARSLARFAANLGPIGWDIAAKRIARALPTGTKFGRGWVGDSEAPQQSQPPLLSSPPPHPSSLPTISPCTTISRADEEGGGHFSRTLPHASTSSASNRLPDPTDCAEPSMRSSYKAGSNLVCAGGGNDQSKAPFQLRGRPGVQPANGVGATFGSDLASQLGKLVRPTIPLMTHGRALDMVSRGTNSFIHQTPMGRLDAERSSSEMDPRHDSNGTWRGLSMNQKADSVPPPHANLNVRFQSPGTPASGAVVVDSQQPDLVLQL